MITLPKPHTVSHGGQDYVFSFGRHQDGTWTILLDNTPFAVGRRVDKDKWVVVRDREKFIAPTITEATRQALIDWADKEPTQRIDLPELK